MRVVGERDERSGKNGQIMSDQIRRLENVSIKYEQYTSLAVKVDTDLKTTSTVACLGAYALQGWHIYQNHMLLPFIKFAHRMLGGVWFEELKFNKHCSTFVLFDKKFLILD
jgi:hypothetical protein